MNKIKEKIRTVLQKLLLLKQEDMKKLTDDYDLEEIGLNSILLLQFIVKLEQELDIEIDEESINPENFGTIDGIENLIKKIM